MASGIRFGFGRVFGHSGKHCECRLGGSLGIIQLSGKPGEKRKYSKVSRKELEDRRRESVCFPLVSGGVLTGEGEAHVE